MQLYVCQLPPHLVIKVLIWFLFKILSHNYPIQIFGGRNKLQYGVVHLDHSNRKALPSRYCTYLTI